MIVVFLQNAWSPMYAGDVWPRPSWMKALIRSRSGQRLKILLDDLECCENTTPHVADNPGGKLPPDFAHMEEIITRRQPKIIVACGLQARDAVRRVWAGHMLAVPHPAARLLTNALYQEARALLAGDYTGRKELLQRRGKTELIDLTQVVVL